MGKVQKENTHFGRGKVQKNIENEMCKLFLNLQL